MSHFAARMALMLGNFVIGVAIVGIAAMLPNLAAGLGVSVQQAGFLITAGAIVLCVGSPLAVWATSTLDRRRLLAGSLLLVALGHFASALAPDYDALLGLRVLMMAAAVPFTPVAAGTIALVVPTAGRASAIAFVFLGWSLAAAAGLPAVALLAEYRGWQATFAAIGVAALACAALVLRALPAGLRGATISLGSWAELARNALVVVLLVVTVLQIAGQFLVFTYLAPLLARLAGAQVAAIGALFATYGIMGLVGNLVATRLVTTRGAYATSVLSLLSIFVGLGLWSAGAGALAVMGLGVAFWGLGFAAFNSMQQARLVGAVPLLGAAAVSLNTSAIYVGQAFGSALGGVLYASDRPRALGYVATALVGASLALLATTRERRAPA